MSWYKHGLWGECTALAYSATSTHPFCGVVFSQVLVVVINENDKLIVLLGRRSNDMFIVGEVITLGSWQRRL